MDKQKIIDKLSEARKTLLFHYPFYGSLVMYMKFGLAACGTAFTDMKRIVFDPEFVSRLSVEEVCFVLQHEVLHCALQHIQRGQGFLPKLYNIACDIVVNSNIMQSTGAREMVIDGETVMHLAPDGQEGYLYTAEEVYEQLVRQSAVTEQLGIVGVNGLGDGIDLHEPWTDVEEASALQGQWKERVRIAAGDNGWDTSDAPQGIRRILKKELEQGIMDWRDVLREFIVTVKSEFDYTFRPPNRNYVHLDLTYPQFNETESERLEQIHFFIDTSGSISQEELQTFFAELVNLTEQFDHIRCRLSFFDTRVSEAIEITDKESVLRAEPVGGGGTSFYKIFEYVREEYEQEMPKGIVILTDGYARFPAEEDAMGVPVLWVIHGSKAEPPFGKYVRYDE